MAAKIVFFLALVALAFGLPVSESNLESASNVAVNEVPLSISLYLEKLFAETPSYILKGGSSEVEEEASRMRRSPQEKVCRRVLVPGPRGMHTPKMECH